MSYEIGSRVGDYEILQILGAGGMGRVYKVRNVISDRVEAMKVLLPDLEGNPGLAERFMREIKVQASLDHPNIAALHTAIRIENQLMMMMEYVEGVTLEAMMEAGPIPIDKAMDCFAQVLSALSYAHGHGVVHRDLKPANMIVTASGQVKLMDFGIAKLTADRKLTQTGSTVGSLYYMSPEQIKGALDLDPRSDLYSLGVSLYEVVTGARPFQGDSEYSIMAAHLKENPRPPVEVSPNLPKGLSDIILQALEKDPAKRFQTADAFRAALLYVSKPGQGAIPAPPPATAAKPATARPAPSVAPIPPVPQAARPPRRGLWIAIGALITIAVIIAVAMQIPKFRKTSAENASIATPAATLPAVSQTPAASPIPDTAGSQGPASQPTMQEAAPPPTNVVPVRPSTASRTPVQTPRGVIAAKSSLASAAVSRSESPSTTPAITPPSYSEPVQTPRTPVAPAEDSKTAEQLKEVKEQLNLLGIRADTVKSSLNNLRRQQAASGVGLRADMTSSAQRMEMFLSQTESALNRRDAEAAKKNLDNAEREVSKLENFLGR
jgi:serine/threonine protein kinase